MINNTVFSILFIEEFSILLVPTGIINHQTKENFIHNLRVTDLGVTLTEIGKKIETNYIIQMKLIKINDKKCLIVAMSS